MYLDALRERPRCREVGGGVIKIFTNNAGGRGVLINEGEEIDPSTNYGISLELFSVDLPHSCTCMFYIGIIQIFCISISPNFLAFHFPLIFAL